LRLELSGTQVYQLCERASPKRAFIALPPAIKCAASFGPTTFINLAIVSSQVLARDFAHHFCWILHVWCVIQRGVRQVLGAAFTLKYLSQINLAEEEGLLDLSRMRLNSFPLEMWVRRRPGAVPGANDTLLSQLQYKCCLA